jgi:hypothetical protein
MLLGLVVVVVVIAAALGLSQIARPATPPSDGAALDPGAPRFPVPAGATLINAQVEGSGPSVYRLAVYTLEADFAAAVTFYADVTDGRWHRIGRPVTSERSAEISFRDGEAAYAQADVVINATTPVRVAVSFVPPAAVAAPSLPIEASPFLFATLPPVEPRADLVPSYAVPPGGRLLEAVVEGATVYAIYDAGTELTELADAYVEALTRAGFPPDRASEAGGIVLRLPGAHGAIYLDRVSTGSRVSLAIRR